MEAWLLEIMRCPITAEPLHEADVDAVSNLRTKLQQKQLSTRMGMLVEDDFDGGLVNQSKTYFFPTRQSIPSLLPDEAIPLK